ncbi:putative chitinase [Ixodes scapularis]
MNVEQCTGVSFGRSGASRVLLRSARDGTLIHVISVGLILTILITMAAMFQGGTDKPAAIIESQPLNVDLAERLPDFPGTPGYGLLDKELYLGARKSICLFRAKNSGLTRHGITYNLSTFPYHLCTHAIYWHATVDRTNQLRAGDLEVDVVQHGFRRFPGLKSANPFLRVFIGVEDDSGLHRVSQDSSSTVNFTLKSLRWVVEHRYDGIFLRWTPPMKNGSSKFPSLAVHMLRTFKRVRHLSVGVVMPVYSTSVDFYPDLSNLVNILEPHSVVVDPLAATSTDSYFKNLFPYTPETLIKYGKLLSKATMAGGGTNPTLCYPVSIAGYSLALDQSGLSSGRKAAPVLVNHQQLSGLAVASYDSTCHSSVWNDSIRLRTNQLRAGDLEVDVVQHGFRRFPGLKSANPFLRVFIGVEDDSGLHRVSQDSSSTVNFTLKSLRWVVEHRYDGIFLRWTPPMKNGSSKFPSLAVHMLRTFKRVRHLSVGVVMPVYSTSVDFYPDLSNLVNILEPHSVVVDPLAATSTDSYFKNLFPYTPETLIKYGKLLSKATMAGGGTNPTLCYPVSIAGYSLALDQSGLSSGRKAAPVLVNHQQLSGLAVASYDSTCHSSVWNDSIRLRYGVLAARKSEWLTYQDAQSLGQLLDAMANVTQGASCLGVWDPEFDDFAGHCGNDPGPGSYPLTRIVFEGRPTVAGLLK